MLSPFLCSPVICECSEKKTQIEKKKTFTSLHFLSSYNLHEMMWRNYSNATLSQDCDLYFILFF